MSEAQPLHLAERDDVPSSDRAGAGDDAYRHAIALCAGSILRMHVTEKLVNKVFGRALQSHAAGLTLVMHCEALHGLGPRPTLAAVQREMGSPRTIAAFFGLLRLAGYVVREPVPGDRRSAWLMPAAPLFSGLRQWLSHHARCAETMGLAAPGLAARLEADDTWLQLYLAHARGLLADTRAAMAGDGAWAWFDAFDCGDRIALMLLQVHFALPDQREARWFPLAARRMADQLGISHSHIRNIVNRAEAQGLLRQDRAGGRVLLSPRFLAESEAWFRLFWRGVGETGRRAAEAERGPA